MTKSKKVLDKKKYLKPNKSMRHHYKKFVKHHFNKHHSTKKRYIKPHKTNKNCKLVTTADPRVFGPELWRSLHRIAQNYPNNPSLLTRENCKKFLQSLPYMIPCSHCGCDFLLYLNHQNVKDICSSKQNLVEFLVNAHNRVSRNLNPNKKTWTVKEANKAYSKERVCIGKKPIWKVCNLEKQPYDKLSGKPEEDKN